MDDKNEQNRITLAIAFIATYLTIIIGFSEKIKTPSTELSIVNDIAFVVFIIFGVIISLLFFLYLVFTALDLDFNHKKEVMLDQEVSKKKINSIRKSLFNWGVRGILISFSYPVYYLLNIFSTNYNSLYISLTLWIFCLFLIYFLLFIIFEKK